MRNKVKMLLLFLFLLIDCAYTQNPHDDYINQQKYWYYRERLKYFVEPSTEPGESQMAGLRNRNSNTSNINYGQHSIYFGYYLGVLATEYYLLHKNGQYADAAKKVNKLQK
ncbi:MAG: hypothetical protein WCQ95_07275 [Bacteroidota bacterium]